MRNVFAAEKQNFYKNQVDNNKDFLYNYYIKIMKGERLNGSYM